MRVKMWMSGLRRIAIIAHSKWPGEIPIRLLHVYSHAKEKLGSNTSSEALKARIEAECDHLQEQEGCLQALQAANARADELAKRGTSDAITPEPDWLVGEPSYWIAIGSERFKTWDKAVSVSASRSARLPIGEGTPERMERNAP